jgi:uncharacterized protein YcbK (DUF882 family)
MTLLARPVFPKELADSQFPVGRLSLYNIHTGERLQVTYRNPSGEYNEEALKDLNWILRCHYSGQVANIDVRAIEFLNLVDKKSGGGNEIVIISGFRSPEYNELLIRQGRGVAKHSLHLLGKAIDIRMPRVPLDALRQTAFNLQYGGVGYYPRSDFVHLDSGRFRFW